MGNCIGKKRQNRYEEQQQIQLQRLQEPKYTDEITADVIDGCNERNDETQTIDLLKEAFDIDNCVNFEQCLKKLNTVPKFCRIYSVNKVDKADGFAPTYFCRPIWYGGHPYLCPIGWRRYCLDLGMTPGEFEKKVGDWPIVYHGTDPSNVSLILRQGMKPSNKGCFLREGERAVYLTPSIEYAGHPRYAKIMELGNGRYMQLCLQIRLHTSIVTEIRPGTLPGAFGHCEAMDPNFKDNKELEWLIHWKPEGNISRNDGLIVCGIMLRITNCHPYKLPQNKWWKHTLDKGYTIPYLDN